jgi:hypothetical protein
MLGYDISNKSNRWAQGGIMLTGDTITHWLHVLEGLLPIVVIVLATAALAVLVFFLATNLLDIYRLLKQKAVFLEITPPANTDRAPDANQRLFAVLHGMEGSRPLLGKLLRRKVVFSAEIPSTREQGIRYVMRVHEAEAEAFMQKIASHVPEAKLRRIGDYLPTDIDRSKVRVLSFKQTNSFAYPLREQSNLERQDPVAYINGAMTQLKPDELMALQLVISPAQIREAGIIHNRLTHNEMLVTQLGKRRLSGGKIFDVINAILFGILDAIGETYHGPSRGASTAQRVAYRKQEVAARIRPARTLSLIEEELAESINRKLQQPLFRVDIRALVIADDNQRRKQRANGVRNALDAFKVPKYQSLKARFGFPVWFRGRYHLFGFVHRLPSIFARNTTILAASEIADLYHFPHSESTKTENVVKSLSKTLPATLALKNGTELEVILGRNHHLGTATDIGLTAEERERHVFIVGGTGNGKTTLLKYAIIQDIRAGKGVAVIDPHGDLAQELLEHIPKERINDVIYFNPRDISYPVGLNLLELPEGLSDDELLRAKDFVAETVVSIMRKTFSDDGTGGHRIEYVLRNAVLTALTVKDATIFTIYDLLTDKNFRKPIVDKLEQDWLKNFWRNEFSKAGDYQQVKMMSGVTSKIGRYHASASAERVLEQPKSTINFDEILDGKILICNLPKGSIGEDTSEIFGISVLAKLQLAAYRRIEQKRTERKPFYAYVDEFQNFATTSFVEMLSEARKYKLFLIMAEQTTSQQDDEKMVNTILTNAGTIICFKSNSLEDERQMLHLFNGKVDPGEIANLPAYNFYAKLSGGLEPQDPVSGITVLVEDKGSQDIAEADIAASRKNYAKKYIAKKKKKTSTQKTDNQKSDQKKDSEKAGEELMSDADGKD